MARNRPVPDPRTESVSLGNDAPVLGVHPAKMHPDLALRLVQDYAPDGGHVLDPFAGCGTTLWACAQLGRFGVGVEVEPHHAVAAKRHGLVVGGDACALPFVIGAFDCVVTSPPYGEAIGRSGDRSPEKTAANKARYEKRRFGRVLTKHAHYGSSRRNLGSMPLSRRAGECFITQMPLAVSEAIRVLKSGGFAVFVVKDQRLGRRSLGCFDLPGELVRWGRDAGAIFYGRRYGLVPQSRWTLWQRVNESRWSIPVPDVEQAIVLRKK